MNQLTLKITGSNYLSNSVILVDGRPIHIKKNQFGSHTATYKTEKDNVNIKLVTYLDHGGIVWFLTQLIFFIISIFGIFDTHEKVNYTVINYEADVTLNGETTLTLRCYPKSNTKPIEVKSDDVSVMEKENSYVINQSAKKTIKILLLSKIILAIAMIVLLVVLLIKYLK